MNRRKIIIAVLVLAVVGIAVSLIREQVFAQGNTHADYRILTLSMEGNTSEVRRLLRSGVDPNTPPGPDDRGMTAIMFASWQGHADIVRVLAEYGANMNAVSGTNSTALMYAASEGNLECARVLLNRGANPDFRVNNSPGALVLAAQHGDVETVRLIGRHGLGIDGRVNGDLTPLMFSIVTREQLMFRTLLAARPNLELVDSDGQTALILAAKRGELEMVRALLVARAKVNARDTRRRTAVRKARELNHTAVVALLREYGARH